MIGLCFVILYSFAIILMKKRGLVALLLLTSLCRVTVSGLWLFLVMSWIGLQCAIVVFPVHTHLNF